MTREQRHSHAVVWCLVACLLVLVILSALAVRASATAAEPAKATAMGGIP